MEEMNCEVDRNPEDSKLKVLARQHYYAGASFASLQHAWSSLRAHCDRQHTKRLINGVTKVRLGVPMEEIAGRLNRNKGEISKWFAGKVPDWANLVMVMSTLRVHWLQLNELGPWEDRFILGFRHALRAVLIHSTSDPPESIPYPEPKLLRVLQRLCLEPNWPVLRRAPGRRIEILSKVSQEFGMELEELDCAEKRWGHACIVLLAAEFPPEPIHEPDSR